jgi:histidyl-tRNA synthetase
VEYTDALGKFLPDQDRPNAGVFSFQDDDDQWLSLRYDLTAPLARYVAENQQSLPTPYRSYRQGWVFRNEKPGPGRFRQFMQFDADTVGSASPAADAEVCMMAADTMEALGIPRGDYVMKVNNRKILDGVLELIGLEGQDNYSKRLSVLRAIDKLDKFAESEVQKLLSKGRRDESGAFTEGAGLTDKQIEVLGRTYRFFKKTRDNVYSVKVYKKYLMKFLSVSTLPNAIADGLEELEQIRKMVRAAKYDKDRIYIDPSVVRGLEYYTGPVFECELLMETKDEDGRPVRFGSVGGGGRYDDLVARFTGQQVPATGFSIGVSRLYSALKLVGKAQESSTLAPVVVLVMDKDRQGDYWRMVQTLRNADIRAEMYVGTAGMKAQMKYADKRGAPLVVIQGGDEKARGEVQIKDLRAGKELASGIGSREEYASQRLAQVSVKENELIPAVKKMLAG